MKNFTAHLRSDWYKYVLEILVIIIGILGAFTLNSWNLERDVKRQEISILKEIRRNVEYNVLEIDGDIERISKRINSFEVFLGELKRVKPNSDTLLRHFSILQGGGFFNGDASGYELLKIKGADVNFPEELRYAINQYFDLTLGDLEIVFSGVRDQRRDYVQDYRRLNFGVASRDSTGAYISTTKDYSYLAKDEEFINSIYIYQGANGGLLRFLNISKEKSEELLTTLERYLDND